MTEAYNSALRLPLWVQLQHTATVVQAVRMGASGTVALDSIPTEVRPGVQALAFHVWRNLGRAEALVQLLVSKNPPAAANALLSTALALLGTAENVSYDSHTLVNQAVEAAKNSPPLRAQSNFINACLRRYLREKNALDASIESNPVAGHNHPKWWIQRLRADHPSAWEKILKANNTSGPMILRINIRKTSTAQYLQALSTVGIAATEVGPVAILLANAVPVAKLPGFFDGLVSVQDAAAQLAAPLLLSGMANAGPIRVLDACAAPGGKTGHLLEISEGHVTALDIDLERCERIRQNVERLQLRAEVICADAAQPKHWWDGRPFDAILLDAPCTASGIVRRHPDVRWLRRETDIAQLAREQKNLLNQLWPLVKPGGRLLFCTCSVFKAEGDAQIAAFLSNNNNATLLPSPGHLLPRSYSDAQDVVDNLLHDHDGFFYALLEKQVV